MRFIRLALVVLACAFCASKIAQADSSGLGVLILAPNGTPAWNKTVMKIIDESEIPYPTAAYFGMGNTREEAARLQRCVNQLQGNGVRSIIVIPLVVSPYSEIYRQWKFLLGAGFQPGYNEPLFPIKKTAEIQVSEPLNDDPIVGLILVDRVREISENPAQETVLLIAHGPNDNSDNMKWKFMLGRLSKVIQQRGHFKRVEAMTLRDDAPADVRGAAIDAFRSRVEAINQEGDKVLVIPFLITPGGIENKIGVILKGTEYSLNGKTLVPDHRISQWIRSKVP